MARLASAERAFCARARQRAEHQPHSRTPRDLEFTRRVPNLPGIAGTPAAAPGTEPLMRLCQLFAALPLVFLVQCMSANLPGTAGIGKITTSSRDAGLAAAMISRYRAAHGLGPVKVDAQLGRAAEHQARAVAVAGELTHGDFAGRMKEYGIRGSAAENLAAGKETLEGTMDQWKSSPGHNANLLLADASRIGLVRAEDCERAHLSGR